MRNTSAVPLISLMAVLAACSNPFECGVPGGLPAVAVTVRDSITGQAAAGDAVGSLELEGEAISMSVGGYDISGIPLILVGGGETGKYNIRIEKPGYVAWYRPGVLVESTNCGIVTRRFNAWLQRGEL